MPAKYNQTQSKGVSEKGMEGSIWIRRRHVVRRRVRIVGGRGGAPRAGGGGADQKESEARGVWGCGGGRGSELDGGDALDQPPHGARPGRRH